MHDTYYEHVQIPDGTPQEMVQFYVNTVNAARAEERKGLSKRYHEFMDVMLTGDWKVDFKGTCFVMLEWKTVKFLTKELFFGEDNIDDGSSGTDGFAIEDDVS